MIQKSVMLITGTSRGIGEHLVEHYLQKGFYIIGCSRSEADIQADNYVHLCISITDEVAVKNMFRKIRSEFGRLDILINNAAINCGPCPVSMLPYESARQAIETNLLGTFLTCRESVKLMTRNSYGRIVNFGSMAVRHEVKGEAIYTASKAAISAFTKVLAKETHRSGITCNVISPSAIQTNLIANIDTDKLFEVLGRNAIPKLGKTEDIVNAIDWLIEPGSQTITGQTIYLGGV